MRQKNGITQFCVGRFQTNLLTVHHTKLLYARILNLFFSNSYLISKKKQDGIRPLVSPSFNKALHARLSPLTTH
uniref:Uncharacterized protein n=1 Tax=Xenopus tropicalis TaxID=8364 RepID=A0A1B8YA26_XENTR